MPTVKPRCVITVDDELFNKIEDFRFEHRFQNRSEAALYLLTLGLKTYEEQEEEKKMEGK